MSKAPLNSVRHLLRRISGAAVSQTSKVPPPQDAPSIAQILPRQLNGNVFGERRFVSNDFVRRFSSINESDEIAALEEEADKKIGWLLKIIFVLTAGYVGYEFFPYMGETLLQQSISLLYVKDPFFKRTGASRLAKYAVDDEKRMKVVELGGAKELLNVLEFAQDDKTRIEALNALLALSHSNEAAGFLEKAGAVEIVGSVSNSSEFEEIGELKSSFLEKLRNIKS
ncbi:hypothetical protein LUZ60_005371 [Juncus effusus]|nr:hypothetical protein LUZ60_005371 [Juncus effusus]